MRGLLVPEVAPRSQPALSHRPSAPIFLVEMQRDTTRHSRGTRRQYATACEVGQDDLDCSAESPGSYTLERALAAEAIRNYQCIRFAHTTQTAALMKTVRVFVIASEKERNFTDTRLITAFVQFAASFFTICVAAPTKV